MRFSRILLHALVVAAVLALGAAGVVGQDEPTPVLISEDGTAGAPPRSDEAAYTQWFVRQAVERYDAEGRDAALAYFNGALAQNRHGRPARDGPPALGAGRGPAGEGTALSHHAL